jgi:RimJ/RimL family protein N-acetyltransferase
MKEIKSNFNTAHYRFVNYTDLTEEQSYAVWKERNNPDIRKWMSNAEPFSFKSHTEYVKSLSEKNDRIYWGVFDNEQMIGSICLNPFDGDSKEGEVGIYLFIDFLGKGLGLQVEKEFVNYMFLHDLCRKIVAKTLIDNKRYQAINTAIGFKITSEDERYVYMELKKGEKR